MFDFLKNPRIFSSFNKIYLYKLNCYINSNIYLISVIMELIFLNLLNIIMIFYQLLILILAIQQCQLYFAYLYLNKIIFIIWLTKQWFSNFLLLGLKCLWKLQSIYSSGNLQSMYIIYLMLWQNINIANNNTICIVFIPKLID